MTDNGPSGWVAFTHPDMTTPAASEYPPCDDCGTDLWYNAWVEDDVWAQIRPDQDAPEGGGGTLCARCIDRRCLEAGLEDVAVRFYWTGEAAKCHSPEEPVGYVVAYDATKGPYVPINCNVVFDRAVMAQRKAEQLNRDKATTRYRAHPIGQPLDGEEEA